MKKMNKGFVLIGFLLPITSTLSAMGDKNTDIEGVYIINEQHNIPMKLGLRVNLTIPFCPIYREMFEAGKAEANKLFFEKLVAIYGNENVSPDWDKDFHGLIMAMESVFLGKKQIFDDCTRKENEYGEGFFISRYNQLKNYMRCHRVRVNKTWFDRLAAREKSSKPKKYNVLKKSLSCNDLSRVLASET